MSSFPIDPPLPATAKRLLVVGGTFDPPHRAHLRLAMAAAAAVHCDHVLFVPTHQSPLKDESPTPAEHRIAMLRLALASVPSASLSDFEIHRPGRSYTIHMLSALRAALPLGVELRLFMGSDQLRSFSRWRQPQRIVELARPVVALRPPDTRQSLCAAGVPDERLAWIVQLPLDDASSTAAREAISHGKDAVDLVEPSVLEYIRAHHLYESDAS